MKLKEVIRRNRNSFLFCTTSKGWLLEMFRELRWDKNLYVMLVVLISLQLHFQKQLDFFSNALNFLLKLT